ncbi:TopA Topoisomerase IA, partial [Pyrenophora tritici-repentis]
VWSERCSDAAISAPVRVTDASAPARVTEITTLLYEEQRVHEFVIRRFLACCSKDAQGSKTDVSILCGPETFNTSGPVILERNYLGVYIYNRWSNQELSQFTEGEVFEPTEVILSEVKTSPPGYLTEPDLLVLMDANGIGNDATMADHIATITDRQYVEARAQPRQARHSNDNEEVALVEVHEKMGFGTNLTKPFLRKEMKLKMKAIYNGQTTKPQVVNETIEQYREVYARMQRHPDILRTVRTEPSAPLVLR